MRNGILTNVHAPGMSLAQTVRKFEGWYGAFDVGGEQAPYLSPEKRVKVW